MVTEFVEFMKQGGSTSSLVFMLTLLGLGLSMVLGLIALVSRRLPVAMWLVVPALVLGVGGLGAMVQLRRAFLAVASSDLSHRPRLAALGLADGLSPWLLALLGAATILTLNAGLAAIASQLRPGAEPVLRFERHNFAGACTIVGAALLLAWSLVDGVAEPPLALVAVLFFVGANANIAGLRTSTDEAAIARRATLVGTTGVCGMLACWTAAGAHVVSTHREVLAALYGVAPDQRAALIEMGEVVGARALQQAGVGAALGLALGVTALLAMFLHLSTRRLVLVLDLGACAVLALLGVVLSAAPLATMGELREWALTEPAPEAVER